VEQQDQELFDGDEFGDYSFLKSLNATELGKRVQKEKLPRDDKTLKPSKIVADVEESEDEFSDEEDLGDVVGDALDANGAKEHKWDDEQPYEQQPRKGDSQWRKKESTRLPVRTATGKLMELEASASESESSDESEASDSDSDTVGASEEPVEEVVKVGKEAVIEAKETLAKLAGEILEEPQERVYPLELTHWLIQGIELEDIPRSIQQGQPDNSKTRSRHTTYRLQRHYSRVLLASPVTILTIDTEYVRSQMPRKRPRYRKTSNNFVCSKSQFSSTTEPSYLRLSQSSNPLAVTKQRNLYPMSLSCVPPIYSSRSLISISALNC
jgi:hypothetical protein